jgi:hypothetical protein
MKEEKNQEIWRRGPPSHALIPENHLRMFFLCKASLLPLDLHDMNVCSIFIWIMTSQ